MKVDPDVISAKFDRLRSLGYITNSDYLTEKGFETLSKARQEGKIRPARRGASQRGVDEQPREPSELTALDVALLAGLVHVKDDDALAKLIGVDPDEVGRRLDHLYDEGYVTEKNRLSAKGYEAVNESGRTTPVGLQTEVPFGSERGRVSQRPIRVAVAATFTLLYGVIGVGLGIAFMSFGLALGGFSSIAPSGVADYASLGGLVIGGALLVMGIVGMTSAWGLWRGERWGAYASGFLLFLGMTVAVIGLLFSSESRAPLVLDEIGGIVLASNIALLVLLVYGFNDLTG